MSLLDFTDCRKKYDFRLNVVDEDDISYNFVNQFKGALIRTEYIIRDSGKYITSTEVLNKLWVLSEKVAKSFYPNPVWYRLPEFTSSEANVLNGVDKVINEKNEICGLRGIRRILRYKESFVKELQDLVLLSKKWQNLHVLIPMINDISQFHEIKELLDEVGYKNKIGIMIEIPSVLFTIDDFLGQSDNFIFGINDLATFILGSYRGMETYCRTHPSVRNLLDEFLIKYNHRISIELSGYIRVDEVKMGIELGFKTYYLRVQDLPYTFEQFKCINIRDRPYNKKDSNSLKVSELP